MSVSSKFIFNSLQIQPDQINLALKSSDQFENKVLTFAQEWLSDKSEFEFQTSGSTGSPKKIIFSRSQILASAALTKNTFQLGQGQQALLCLDPDFIAGKMMIVRALVIGMDLVCISPSANPLEVLQDNIIIEFAAFVPYQLEAILNSETSKNKINQIRKVIVGGSAVSDELSQRLQSHPTQFFETYGMTETLTHIALRRLNPPDSTFHALAGVRLLVDERQCLNIQANHLGADAIQTNDLVTISSDNSFRLVGRYDNVINTAGVKISPEAVEKKIATILSNNLKGCDFFIGSRKDRLLGERVVLFVENEEINNQRKNQILDLIRTDLKKWEVPKEIVCLPVFKRTPSGKVNRTATLRDLNS